MSASGETGSYTLVTANRNYSSWSLRSWVLMKALDIPFVDRVEQFAQAVNYEAFRAFSPTGQVPVLLHGTATVWDSLGIALYLADRHDGVWPAEREARAFAQSGVAEMHGGFAALRGQCPMNVGVRVRLDHTPPDLARDIGRVRELFETALQRFGGPFLAGDRFTALDAFYAPVAYRVRTFALAVGPGQAWVEHILATPPMREWERAALAETWREPSHEQEIGAAGTLIEDFRAT